MQARTRLSVTQRNFDRFLGMIVGVEMEIIEARGIFKLAQDKGPENARAAVHLTELAKKDIQPLLSTLLQS